MSAAGGRRRRPVSKVKTAVVGGGLALLTGVLLVIFFLQLSQRPGSEFKLGDDVFEVGQARRLAPEIDKRGPLLFQDLLGRGRHIYVQHIGGDAAKGWLAINAVPPGQPERCAVTWHQDRGVFEDPCTKVAYPPEGTGLTHYPTEVRKKDKGGLTLFVDLRTAVQRD